MKMTTTRLAQMIFLLDKTTTIIFSISFYVRLICCYVEYYILSIF